MICANAVKSIAKFGLKEKYIMDMSDILQIGVKLFKNSIGNQANSIDDNSLMSALGGLLGSGNGAPSLGSIISSLSDGNLTQIVSSWIGSGENQPIDEGSLASMLGSDQISSVAEKLGLDSSVVAKGLSNALPDMVDKATPDGSTSMLDSFGGLDGIMDLAGGFFGGKS